MRARRLSGVTWLALGYALLIAYASLYPFGPWDWPARLGWGELWRLPWPRYWLVFDVWANALGYVPLGVLVFTAAWRGGHSRTVSGLLAVGLPVVFAYGIEVAQRFVALRVPSLADWLLNAGGGALGAAGAAWWASLGGLSRWASWRERGFAPEGGGALALLVLWPLGLLFPLPAPLAQGQFLPQLLGELEALLQERQWLEGPLVATAPLRGPGVEWLASFLGLLAPCLLVLAVTRPGRHRAALLLLVAAAGVGVSAVSAVMEFGPPHAWSWFTVRTGVALTTALLLALGLSRLPARGSAVLALPVLTALLLLVTRMDPDPYLLANLQRWEHSPRFPWVGLLQAWGRVWPALALGWLMFSLLRHDARRLG